MSWKLLELQAQEGYAIVAIFRTFVESGETPSNASGSSSWTQAVDLTGGDSPLPGAR